MSLERDLLDPFRSPMVKICGVRTPADLDACAAAGVDAGRPAATSSLQTWCSLASPM